MAFGLPMTLLSGDNGTPAEGPRQIGRLEHARDNKQAPRDRPTSWATYSICS